MISDSMDSYMLCEQGKKVNEETRSHPTSHNSTKAANQMQY